MILVFPDESWEKAAMDYRQSYLDAGEAHIHGSSGMERYPVYTDWLGQIRHLREAQSDGQTPATTFFAVEPPSALVVGTIQVRHRLTDELRRSGGNIGYGVRPDQRGKGFAVQMLRLALPFCREIGLDRVLLDCRADNLASQQVILRCGGVFDSEDWVEDDWGRPERICRFWIATE